MAETLAPPLERPKQATLLSTLTVDIITLGSVTVDVVVTVHPFASVTVTIYVPAATPIIDAVVAELLHAYVYGEVPPVADAVAPPSEPPLQETSASTTEEATNDVGSVIVEVVVAVQPFASVTVAVYVPAETPVIDAVVSLLLHEYVYGEVPPVADAVAPPSLKPLQVMLFTTLAAITPPITVIVSAA